MHGLKFYIHKFYIICEVIHEHAQPQQEDKNKKNT
jgi:hypothetical protein